MDSPYAQHAVPSQRSPGIYVSRPEYASVPHRASDEDVSMARNTRRSRFEEAVGPGLGIQMQSIPSPKSPGNVYSQQQTPKSALFSPFSPNNTPRPLYARTPDTLYSFGSSISRTRTDPMTERLIAYRATQSAQWKVHWRTPALMVFAFLAGIALALAQHFWYRFLHHRAVEDENTKVRWVLYGRALAYLSKVAFGGCVVLVFRQRIWRTFRERALTVLSIDQLFGATDDPSLFVNWDTVSNAPIAVAIAMVFWLIPLATIIFSPGALTFGDYPEKTTVTGMVPTLNFTTESFKDWRSPIPYEGGGNKISVMYYNSTDKLAETVGWIDYYDQPSAELKRIALLFGYNNIMNHSTNKLGARQANCGGSYDCLYEQTFIAPGYKCDEVARGVGDNSKLVELGAPFNTSVLVPEGRKIYHAQVDLGDYKHPQAGTFKRGPGGIPDGKIPDDLGVFKHEPVLWLGISVNSTKRVADDYPFKQNWTHRYDPSILRCVLHEAQYTVSWNYSGPYFHDMTTVQYLAPVIDTDFPRYEDGTPNYDADPSPVQNYISPRNDVALYKKTAAYHAMGDVFRDFLRGSIEMEAPLPGPSYGVVDSPITRTRLVTANSEPKDDFINVLEGFYSDMVLSLFSAPEMLAVGKTEATVYRTRSQSSFVFMPTRLWMCYAPVIFVTLVILLFGIATIYEDGTTFSTGFSRILVTTRNTTLDDISRGACLGNDPFPMELMHTRLKFGVLSDGSESEYVGFEGFQHCAFGVASEVAPIRKGAQYAGLTRRRRVGKVLEAVEEERE